MKKTASRVLWTVGLLAAAWGLLWTFRLQWSSPAESLWITGLFSLCALPSVLFVAGHKFRIPFMPMWGLGFFMLFGVPMLSRSEQVDIGFVSELAVGSALQLAVLGVIACLLTFYTPLGSWAEGLVPRVKAPWDPRRAPIVGSCLAMVGIGFHYLQRTAEPSPSWGQLFFIGSQLGILGMLTLFLLQLRGQSTFKLRLFLWGGILPVQVMMGLGTGLLYNAIVLVTPLLFCYTAERRRIPWQWMGFLTLCLIPLVGAKQEYRSYAWYGDTGEINIPSSPVQQGIAFLRLAIKRLTEGGVEAYSFAVETTQSRVSQLRILITVMESTPGFIPFWKGQTYQYLFWSLAPRILFPNKPMKTLGQEFGHRYGFLDPDDVSTSVNLPHQVVEMYLNFGTAGVVLGMALIGCVYRAMATLLSHPDSGERSLIIGCGLLSNLLNLESDFSLVFGGVAWYLLIMYLATRLLRPRPGDGSPAIPSA